MQKLINKLIFSCQKACELIDKKSLAKLTVKENVMLRMHTAVCDGCKTYQVQSKKLDELLKLHIQKTDETQIPHIINNELKQQIISKL